MATYRLYLDKPNNEVSQLMCELRKKGDKIRISTELKVPSKYWDSKNKVLLKRCPDYAFLSVKLNKFVSIVGKWVVRADIDEMNLSELKTLILKELGREVKEDNKQGGLLGFYKYWANTSFGSHTSTRQIRNHYKTLCEYLNNEDVSFESVNYEFYIKFKSYLDDVKNYKPNTTSTHLKDLKAVMAEAQRRGLHNSDNYKAIKKKFVDIDSVYLTIDEINKLYEYPLYGMKQMARDLFVLGCHTAMRYSDYSQLNPLQISDGKITNINKKTKTTVIVPAHPRVIEILNRWGRAPKVSQEMLNRLIKVICMEMGIFNQAIPVRTKEGVTYVEKYNLITTHTARRSGATNMFLSGIPAQSIMKITGHATESSFLKYLRISKEQNANLLADNPFFKE